MSRFRQEDTEFLIKTLTEFLNMATTLEEIGTKLDALSTAIAGITAPAAVDLAPVLAAIADLKTEVVSNVEGVPAPAPDSAPAA